MKNFFAKTSFMLLPMFFFGIAEADLGIDDLFDEEGKFCLYGKETGGATLTMGERPPICMGMLMLESRYLLRLRKDGNIERGGSKDRRNFLGDAGKDGVSRLIMKLFPDVNGGSGLVLSKKSNEVRGTMLEVGSNAKAAMKKKDKHLTAFADSLLFVAGRRNKKEEGGTAKEWEKKLELGASGFLGEPVKGENEDKAKKFIKEALEDEEKYGYPVHTVENVILAYIALFLPNTGILGEFYKKYEERKKIIFGKIEGKKDGDGYWVGKYSEADTKTLEVIAKYFRSGSWIYGSACVGGSGVEKFNKKGEETGEKFADCQETVTRNTFFSVLGNNGIKKLRETGEVAGIVASEKNRIGRIKEFCENVEDGKWNSTSGKDRNNWNKVVCNIEGVRYVGKDGNELLTGYWNFINTLAGMLGSEIVKLDDPFLDGEGGGEEKLKERLKGKLIELFRIINPECTYDLTFTGLEKQKKDKKEKDDNKETMDVFGKLKVEVKNNKSECVHVFDINQEEIHGSVVFKIDGSDKGWMVERELDGKAKNGEEAKKKKMNDAAKRDKESWSGDRWEKEKKAVKGAIEAEWKNSLKNEIGYMFLMRQVGQSFCHRGYRYPWSVRGEGVEFEEFQEALERAEGTEKKELIEAIGEGMGDAMMGPTVTAMDTRKWEKSDVYKKYCRSITILGSGENSGSEVNLSEWKNLKDLSIEGNWREKKDDTEEGQDINVPDTLRKLNLAGTMKVKNRLDFSGYKNLKEVHIGGRTQLGEGISFPATLEKVRAAWGSKIGKSVDLSGCENLKIENNAWEAEVVGDLTINGLSGEVMISVSNEGISGAVDVSKCKNLNALRIHGATKIGGIVIGCGSLKQVSIEGGTEIGGIDLGRCEKMEKISIDKNAKVKGKLVPPRELKGLEIYSNVSIDGDRRLDLSGCKGLTKVVIGDGGSNGVELVLPGNEGDVEIEGGGVGNVTISYASASASSSDDLNAEIIADGETSGLEKGYAGANMNMNAGNPAAPQELVAVGEG
jgi:hypothetical protein